VRARALEQAANDDAGLHHWLMHADPPVTESVIVVVDPDMFFMDTITQDGLKTIKVSPFPPSKALSRAASLARV